MSVTQSTRSMSAGNRHRATRRSQAMQAVSSESRAVQQLCELPADLIAPDPSQPSRRFDETALATLAESIRESGVLRPVLVRPCQGGAYQLIAGERRWCAAQIAGLQMIPSLVCHYDDSTTLEAALIENMKHDDLSRVEEARVCGTLTSELGLTYQQAADRLERSVVGVAHLIYLLKLSEEILELIERGELGIHHGRALLLARDLEVREELASRAATKRWTVATLQARARVSNEDPAAALNEDVPVPLPGQYSDETSIAIARGWGDLLGAEVRARVMINGRVRIEIRFNSPAAAHAAARRLSEAGISPPQGC